MQAPQETMLDSPRRAQVRRRVSLEFLLVLMLVGGTLLGFLSPIAV